MAEEDEGTAGPGEPTPADGGGAENRDPPTPAPPAQKEPWPLSWVVWAILAYMVVWTFYLWLQNR